MTILFADGQPIRSILRAKATSGQGSRSSTRSKVEPEVNIAGHSFLAPAVRRFYCRYVELSRHESDRRIR